MVIVSIIISGVAIYMMPSVPEDVAKKSDLEGLATQSDLNSLRDRISGLEEGQSAILEELGAETPARLSVTSINVPSQVTAGQTATVSAIVTNTGGQEGTKTIDFIVDGETMGSQDVTVGPGETETVTFEITKDEEGTYNLNIGGAAATLTVVVAGPGGPLKIGRISPITGDLSFINPGFVNASKLARDDINDAGGVLGEDVKLFVEDTGTDPTTGVQATRSLIDVTGVNCIVGPAGTPVGMAIIDIIKDAKIPTISPSTTAPEFTGYEDDDFYFRLCPSDQLQGAAMAKLAYDQRGYRSVGILSRNDAYGIGLEKVFETTFEDLGGEVLQTVRYDPGAATFDSELRKAAEGDIDAIVLNALMEDGVKILRTAHDMGITEDTPFVVCEGVQSPKIPDEVGKTAGGEYIVHQAQVGGATPYPETAEGFVQKFKDEFGEEPWAYMSNVYDATVLLALATEEAGTTDPVQIRDHLRSVANPPGTEVTDVEEALNLVREGEDINYQGYSSTITIDEHGDIEIGLATVWYYGDNGAIVEGEKIGVPS